MELVILAGVFLLLFVLGVPVAFCIGTATLASFLVAVDFMPAVTTIAQRMAGGLNSFALLAIPLFILSGQLMARGGIARRLIDFSKAIIGMVPGGLAFVNVISCMLFGSISGSAVAATSAVGGFMIPEMEKEGYDRNFSAAITATASTTGLLIPPSNILIIYAVASGGVSIAALFVAGYLPGLLMGLALIIVAAGYARKHKLPAGQRVSLRESAARTLAALPSLLLVLIVIGGILGGIFTATEAGAVAVIYALTLAVFIYKEVKISELKEILLKSAETTAIVMFLIGASMAMSWLLTYQEIPQSVSHALLSISDNKIVLLLLINVLLLFVGAFMDMTPAILIFTPIFLPVATRLGIDPIHFGMIMVANLSIGLCSPPVGTSLFVGCSVGKTTLAKVTPYLIPLFIAMIVALMIVSLFPQLSLWLPGLLGLTTAS